MRTRISIVAVAAIVLAAIAVPALAHDLEVDADPAGCRQVTVTVTAWSGFADDLDGYAGDDARTVTVGVLVDGIQYTTVDLAPPTFTAATTLIVPAGVRQITAVPVSAWGDGQPADPNSAQTVTVRATCVVGTTTTTTPVSGCPEQNTQPGVPCQPDTTTTTTPNVEIPEMPDPDPVPGTPKFTG